MPDTSPDTSQNANRLQESIDEIKLSLKQKEKDDKVIKWLTLISTVLSTVLISGVGLMFTTRNERNKQALQEVAVAQNLIHDLSSEDDNVRSGAERYLASGPYYDLVLKDAVAFGDAEMLRHLLDDDSMDQSVKTKFQEAINSLMTENAKDKACVAGQWKGTDSGPHGHAEWTFEITGPKRLQGGRGEDDGGIHLNARKVDENRWQGVFFYGNRPPQTVELNVSPDCRSAYSSWGWHFTKGAAAP